MVLQLKLEAVFEACGLPPVSASSSSKIGRSQPLCSPVRWAAAESTVSPFDQVRKGLVWAPGLLAGPRFLDSELAGCGKGSTILQMWVPGRRQVSLKSMGLCDPAPWERPREETRGQRPSKQMEWGDWVATDWWPHLGLCQEKGAGLGCQNQYPGSQSLSHCQEGLPNAPGRGRAGTLDPNWVGSRLWTTRWWKAICFIFRGQESLYPPGYLFSNWKSRTFNSKIAFISIDWPV